MTILQWNSLCIMVAKGFVAQLASLDVSNEAFQGSNPPFPTIELSK